MCISRLVSRAEAIRESRNPQLYDGADEWVLDETPLGGTPLHLHRRLDPSLTRRIRRILASDVERGLCFKPNTPTATSLDPQATRNVPCLTDASAQLLDRIIELTDAMKRTGKLITVTEEMINDTVTVQSR